MHIATITLPFKTPKRCRKASTQYAYCWQATQLRHHWRRVSLRKQTKKRAVPFKLDLSDQLLHNLRYAVQCSAENDQWTKQAHTRDSCKTKIFIIYDRSKRSLFTQPSVQHETNFTPFLTWL
uniref:Uncharacterized protein n=1 Tax=Opuntia streptacantha TaxID=393608 RepID=A0A7C9DFR3_OPUST